MKLSNRIEEPLDKGDRMKPGIRSSSSRSIHDHSSHVCCQKRASILNHARPATILVIGFILIFLLAACTRADQPLPKRLYFIEGKDQQAQVWRLETDGVTRTQLTREGAGVSDFAVSTVDGSIAFISENHLFLMDGDGKDRRLIADDSQVDWNAEDAVFRSSITNPEFSPDGQTLAYGFDGLHLYDLNTGADTHVLTNLGNLLGESFIFAKEVYVPGSWSPDGKRLLIVMSYFEGSTLAVMTPGEPQPFQRLWSSGPVCCQYVWSTDSRALLVANPDFGTQPPGFWRYDALTGAETVIVEGISEDGSMNFIGWPVQEKNGDLLYFASYLTRFSPDTGISLTMFRSKTDGSKQEQILDEPLRIWQALWAQDGSRAVILGRDDTGVVKLWLARTDGSPLEVLVDPAQGIRSLAWGP